MRCRIGIIYESIGTVRILVNTWSNNAASNRQWRYATSARVNSTCCNLKGRDFTGHVNPYLRPRVPSFAKQPCTPDLLADTAA